MSLLPVLLMDMSVVCMRLLLGVWLYVSCQPVTQQTLPRDVGSSPRHSLPQYCRLVHTFTCVHLRMSICVYSVSRRPDVLCLGVGKQVPDHAYLYSYFVLQRRPCPEESATFLSRITWWWLNGYARVQYTHTLPI